MAIGDVLELTHSQTYGNGGEPMMNKYYYRVDDASGSANQCATSFENDVLPLIEGIQDAKAVSTGLRVVNLFDPEDFHDRVLSGHAGDNGDGSNTLPMFAAVQFTLKASTRLVRPGSKRYGGISETFQDGGIWNDAGWITAANLLRVQLATNLPGFGVEDALVPIVVKRIFVPADAEADTKDHYRLPATSDELVYGTVTAALLKLKVSHQTSRGNGR